MISLSRSFQIAFVACVVAHTMTSAGLGELAWWIVGIVCALGVFPIKPTAPTFGLAFILFASGGLLGYIGSDLFTVTRSWASYLPVLAGLCFAALVLLCWMLMAYRVRATMRGPVDRPLQQLVMLGLPLLLLLPSDQGYMLALAESWPLDPIQVTGVLAMLLLLIPSGHTRAARDRTALLMPTLVLFPVVTLLIVTAQGPFFTALGLLAPKFSEGSNTGFSPSQRLKPSQFLKPSTKPVMRITVNGSPSLYLVGSRHALFDGDTLAWMSKENLSGTDTSVNLLPSQVGPEFSTFELQSNHLSSDDQTKSTMRIESLRRDDFLFIPTGASSLHGDIQSIYQDRSQVWRASFERPQKRRWRVELDGRGQPALFEKDELSLPDFWDSALEIKAQGFLAKDHASTVKNIVSYFRQREYSLAVEFDTDRPFHDFFLNEKPAFCFWYATATVLSLRTNGVPARVVSGYLMGEALADDVWIVRERDAHTWVEWQDEQGYWHTVDPTPASYAVYLQHYQSSEFNQWFHLTLVRAKARWDAFDLSDKLEDWMIVVGFIFLLFLFIREYLRVRRSQTDGPSRSDEWQKIWAVFLKASQLPNQTTWTVTDYVENLPRDWSDTRHALVTDFLTTYNEHRFASRNVEQLDQLRRLIKRIRHAKG